MNRARKANLPTWDSARQVRLRQNPVRGSHQYLRLHHLGSYHHRSGPLKVGPKTKHAETYLFAGECVINAANSAVKQRWPDAGRTQRRTRRTPDRMSTAHQGGSPRGPLYRPAQLEHCGKPGWPSLRSGSSVTVSSATAQPGLPPANVRSGHRTNLVAPYIRRPMFSVQFALAKPRTSPIASVLLTQPLPHGELMLQCRPWPVSGAPIASAAPAGGLRQRERHLRRQQQDRVRR